MSHVSRNLKRLLAPRHIAYIGGRQAKAAMDRCRQFGFAGELWQVHPSANSDTAGVYASVKDLPQTPDAAYLAISSERTLEVVASLAERGVGGCVCFAAGFAEKGANGVELQNLLTEAAGDMALIGPNCFGFLDYRYGVHLWSGEAHERFDGPGIGIVSQSGALAEFLTMGQRSAPLVSVVSVGNQAVVTLEDVVAAQLEDDGIVAIGIYVEGLRDIEKFSDIACTALSKKVPIVAMKAGRSETGARITQGHTSSLAGQPQLYDALFRRLGITQTDSPSHFLEILKLLSITGPLPGRRVAAVTVSGGQAALFADQAPAFNLKLPELTDSQLSRLRAGLPDYVQLMNPLDMTVGPLSHPEQLGLIFDVIAQGNIDVLYAAMDSYADFDAAFGEETRNMFEAFATALKAHQCIGVAASCMPETLPVYIRDLCLAQNITPLQGLSESVAAIAAGVDFGERLAAMETTGAQNLRVLKPSILSGAASVWAEDISKKRLAENGITTPGGRTVGEKEVLAAARELGFPVVLKALVPNLIHKSDVGGVAVDIQNQQTLTQALQKMREDLPVTPTAYLVEPMINDVVCELIIGISHDSQFGHTLTIGSGGVLVELLRDSVTLLLPSTRSEIEKALYKLRSAPLLRGFRGRVAGDVEALIDTIERVMAFTHDKREQLLELDINPLLVRSVGKGVVAADALIRWIDCHEI